MWITTNCGKFLEMRIPDHLTCLLRNLHAGQEVAVRTGQVIMGWFQIVKREILDVQSVFIKGRGTRDQIANICWIIEKAREFQKSIYFCFIDFIKAFDCVDHNKLLKILRDENTRPPYLFPQKPVCGSRDII